MSRLTRAELSAYPGGDPTEQLCVHHREEASRLRPPRTVVFPTGFAAVPDRVGAVPVAWPGRSRRPSPLPLPRRIDIRRLPGRDRTERVAHYLRGAFPRAASWSDASVREIAGRLIATAEIVE